MVSWLSRSLLLAAIPSIALATKPKPSPEPPKAEQSQSVSNAASQAESTSGAESTATATGGAASAESATVNSNDYTNTSRNQVLALANTAPAPLHDTPDCFLPGKGVKRIRQVLFGAVSFDSRLVLSRECLEQIEKSRQYARDMAELELRRIDREIERDRVAIERMRAERERTGIVAK
jgi:hypothetical protein